MISKENLKRINTLIGCVKIKYNIEILKVNISELSNKIMLKCKIKKNGQQKIKIKENDIILKNDILIMTLERDKK